MTNQRSDQPMRIINSRAPIRICDNGGWTDTWFAEYGRVFNLAVAPYAEVQIEVYPAAARPDRITIYAENYGERYVRQTGQLVWDRHPLLEAALERLRVPEELAVQVTIFSEAPAGASTGTSAAVTVALVGALDCLTPGRLTPHEVAYTAHSIEVDMLQQQCGIQDQLCSAYGGINLIEMPRYPEASVTPIPVSKSIWWELDRRLILVYLGQSHSSSAVHQKVIRELENAGPESPKLIALRRTAEQSWAALVAGDFAALGQAMIDNTAAQGNLHPELISPEAQQIIEIAQQHEVVGWKVNGAGGEGGSITLLGGPLSPTKRALIRVLQETNPRWQQIPIALSRYGLRAWETPLVNAQTRGES